MKIALGQINTTVGAISANVEKILAASEKAKRQGAELIIFPELSVCGYPPMDLLLKETFIQANLAGLETIKNHLTAGITAIVGFADKNRGQGRPLYNACAAVASGQIKAIQHKTLLPTYDVFDEDRYFEPAHGVQIYQLGGLKIGLSICEDIWNYKEMPLGSRYGCDPVQRLVDAHIDLLINISASPFVLGKQHVRRDLLINQARRHQLPIIYVNLVGASDDLVFDGRSLAVDAKGKLRAAGKAFEEDLIIVELEANKNKSDSIMLKGEIADFPESDPANIYAALVLGVQDYMGKCGFSKAVVGLSGGIDSAVTVALAVAAIGADNVIGVAMPSPYSSSGSLADAGQLAENLGVALHVVPIEPAMQSFDRILKDEFAGLKQDVTEENIQARIRGAVLMALSNKFGYLVLTTGNKSELAMGYCTLYGDMCGGLAVISDLLKTSVYALARYINDKAHKEIIPQNSIDKPPSAELRPGQKDEDSLPPYVVLDPIILAYVEQKMNLDEIAKLGYDAELVQQVVNRIDHNEYKRKQAAPGLKVTGQAFGSGWKMPIAQRFEFKLLTS